MPLAIIATLVAFWWVAPIGESRTDPRSELAIAAGAVRTLEGRLCGGFVHAPYPSPMRQGKAVRRTAHHLQRELERRQSASAMAALATLRALASPEEKLSAIRNLKKAITLAPKDACSWSDLAALYLELAENQASRYCPQALEAALRAVALHPELPEARFNLALALEKNFLQWRARAAWLAYTSLDTGSAWTAEAEVHLQRLRQPPENEVWKLRRLELEKALGGGDSRTVRRIAKEFPTRVRAFADEELLPRWAASELEHDRTAAEALLRGARWIGEELDATITDGTIIESVIGIERARPGSLRRVAQGYKDYAEGSAACLANQPTRGRPLLLSARRGLGRAASPMEKWADLQLALCAYQASDFNQSRGMLDKLLSRDVSRYPTLRGRALWMQGLSNLSVGEPALTLLPYQDALIVFEKLGARAEQAAMHYLIGQALDYLGDTQAAWNSLFRGIELATSDGHPWRRYTALLLMADVAAREGLQHAALLYETEALRIALKQRDPAAAAFSLGRRALLLTRLNRADQGHQDLRLGHVELAKINDAHEHRQREADLLLAHGRLHAGRDCSALRSLDGALELYREDDQIFKLLDVYLIRARARRACSQDLLAEEDLRAGISEFEREREPLADPAHRRMYFDRARDLFDELISLTLERKDQNLEVFVLSERRRARLLLDQLPNANWLTAGEVSQQLPADHALIAYASLPRELITFVLRRDEPLQMHRRPLSSDQLASVVAALLRGIDRQSESDVLRAAAVLYQFLLAPVRAELERSKTLIFVPDGVLHRVPFAALYNSTRKRFLVEDHVSTTVPSASVFVEGCKQSRKDCGEPRALILADPELDSLHFPTVAPLRGAREEAVSLKELYRERASVLIGKQATETAFAKKAGAYHILHLGVHARGSLEFPGEAHLLFSGAGAKNGGMLGAGAVEHIRFTCTRVVCLSACRSGGEAEAASEGPLSLARAFHAAGVPQIIATLWAIDDESSPAFVTELHRSLRNGLTAGEALRQAQLSFIARPRLNPRLFHTWAAYQSFGCTS